MALTACSEKISEHPVAKNIEGIEDFPYEFKMPTYFPYQVEEVRVFDYFQTTEELPLNLADAKPADFTLTIGFGDSSKDKFIFVEIRPFLELKVSNNVSSKLIELDKGNIGIYYNDGRKQIFSWNEEMLNYQIIVFSTSKEDEPYLQEDLIKMANSLEPYKNNN
ncbi:hypothetical protein [Sutcliffiella halmapala]|uniref:hypothetical protein n=1 Tax=Sutcliffiella halmapala TaxID=79882 RepID=UPI0009959BBF|nr:hypothetical protein [Sutcliffiella halmapala]